MNEILLAMARHGLLQMTGGTIEDGPEAGRLMFTLHYRVNSATQYRVEGRSPNDALVALDRAMYPDAEPLRLPDDRAEAVRLLAEGLVQRIDSITHTDKLTDHTKHEALLNVRAALNRAIEYLTE